MLKCHTLCPNFTELPTCTFGKFCIEIHIQSHICYLIPNSHFLPRMTMSVNVY